MLDIIQSTSQNVAEIDMSLVCIESPSLPHYKNCSNRHYPYRFHNWAEHTVSSRRGAKQIV